jgi:CubicO group peptidase (beta-lactamase class C family)
LLFVLYRFTIVPMNRSKHAGIAALALLLTTLGTAAEDRPHVPAEQVDKAIAALDALAAKQTAIPGFAVAVVFKDKAVYAKGFGIRDVNDKAPVNADTVFQLASVSKPIGAAVVAALVGDGKITWDSRLSELDPTFVMFDPWVTREVTIRDMYAHRSGLPDHAGDLLEDLGFSCAEILRRLRYQHPDSSFRSHYAYTNFGITAAAVAAVKAYGMDWEAASEEKLYKPLGMTATSSRYSDFVGRANKALGHVMVDGKWVQKFQRDPDAQTPAGGVSSSVNDLAKWIRLELANGKFEGKTIVNEKALIEARRPHMLTGYNPFTGVPTFYGLGWNVSYDGHGRLQLSHSGAFALGAATSVTLLPGEQLGVVVLTNAYPIGFAEALGTTFIDLTLYGRSTQDWFAIYKNVFSNPAMLGVTPGFDYGKAPSSPAAALKPEAYTGTYQNDFFGEVSVSEQHGALAMIIGPQNKSFPLQHYDRDTFIYQTEGENAAGPSGATFTIGPDGKATEMTVESLNIHGEGRFKHRPQ